MQAGNGRVVCGGPVPIAFDFSSLPTNAKDIPTTFHWPLPRLTQQWFPPSLPKSFFFTAMDNCPCISPVKLSHDSDQLYVVRGPSEDNIDQTSKRFGFMQASNLALPLAGRVGKLAQVVGSSQMQTLPLVAEELTRPEEPKESTVTDEPIELQETKEPDRAAEQQQEHVDANRSDEQRQEPAPPTHPGELLQGGDANQVDPSSHKRKAESPLSAGAQCPSREHTAREFPGAANR